MKLQKTLIRTGLCLLTVSSLSGCLAVAAGGTAGYLVAKDKGSVGKYAQDSVITSKVKTNFLAKSSIKSLNISVSTTNRIVTLSGSVPNQKMKDIAVKTASQTGGVKGVNSDSLKVS